MTVVLDGSSLSIEDVVDVARNHKDIGISEESRRPCRGELEETQCCGRGRESWGSTHVVQSKKKGKVYYL